MKNQEKILRELGKLTEEQITGFFSIALDENNEALLKLAILLGADVTARNNYAIQIVSANGYAEVVKHLIEAGADVTASDNFAIQIASLYGYVEVVKLLEKAGARL